MANSNSIVLFSTLSYYDGKIKTYLGDKDAAVLQSAKDYADGLIPEVAKYSLAKATTAADGYAATYNLTKDGVVVGDSINIPKDFVVKSASLEKCTVADTPETGYVIGDKYIDFVVNTVDNSGNETHIYLKVTDLVDVYTAGDGINISNDNKVSLVTQDGTKTVGGISSDDYTSFSGAVTKSETNETAIAAINNPSTGAVATSKAYTDELANGAVAENTTAIAAINNPSTGAVATSKAYTDELANGAVAENTTAIAAINNPSTGAVTSKSYADGLNSAMDERVKALEEAPYASNDDIDSLFA